MDFSDNFNECEIELNVYGAEYKGRPYVDDRANTGDHQTHKRCIRKGEVVCFVKEENINTDSKTNVSTEADDVTTGESLYKTFNFEESLHDTDTQKCIAFWKSVMEKNLTPIKCTIIEDKKRRHKAMMAEPEKIHSPSKNTTDLIKEATDKVHAEYKRMWKTALNEIQKKKLDQAKRVGRARCKLCESIKGPMEEYTADADNTIKEVKGFNRWTPVSVKGIKRLEKKKSPPKRINERSAEKDTNEYKFVSVVEEKKKRGAHKLWKSNKVKPPCVCGRDNCECNINPDITSGRVPLGVPSPPTSSIEGKRSTPITSKQSTPTTSLEGKRSVPVPQKISEPGSVEGKSKSFPGTPKFGIPASKSMEEKKSEPLYSDVDRMTLTTRSVEEKKSKEVPVYKDMGSIRSADSTKRKFSDPTCGVGPPPDVTQTPPDVSHSNDDIEHQTSQLSNIIRLMSESLANELSAIFVKKVTPHIKLLAANLLKQFSAVSTVSGASAFSALPYADESTFLKVASGNTLEADISAMFMKEALPELTKMMSDNFMTQLEEILFDKAHLHTEEDNDITSVSGLTYDNPPPPEDTPAQPESKPSPELQPRSSFQSSLKKPEDQMTRNLDSLLLAGAESSMVGRQLSFMLPTGEVKTIHKTIPTKDDLTWEKPKIQPPRLTPGKLKSSIEKFKIEKTKKSGKGPKSPSLESFNSNECDNETSNDTSLTSIDLNLACLIDKEAADSLVKSEEKKMKPREESQVRQSI